MRLPSIFALTSSLALFQNVAALQLIQSTSLNPCQDNSSFTASLFNVILTPENKTLTFDVVASSSITGNVTFNVEVLAYGYSFLKQSLSGCDLGLPGLCPMHVGQIDIPGNWNLTDGLLDRIPGIVYGVPDLDVTVRVQINSTNNPGASVACVEANLSNGKTVDQKGVSWATAVVAGLALVVSAVISGLGHSTTAAHVATYALALFSYFQGVAICGMVAVPQPPMMQSWTQNFQWTMGVIQVGFMQRMATWYLKATGGTPATLLNTLTTTSVQVLKKRSMETTIALLESAHAAVFKRSNNQNTINALTGTYTVKGINRVAFRANMEASNLFFTGLSFFIVFIVFTVLGVALFKGVCELMVRAKWMKSDKFEDFRNGWLVVLKGILFRMILIGYPQICVLCMWEFTQIDSAAEVVLAVFFFFGMSFTLGWAAWKVIRIAKRSTLMHKNPAYILYSDPNALNKWGFLYVQFRATAYYYILPTLLYILIKGMFVGLAQKSGATQAIALLIIEGAALVGASVYKPWMDKRTNAVFIAICSMNFVNAILLLIFSDIFNQPELATGICGVLFFVFNAIFALVLLIVVVVVTVLALIRKNPDTRYQAMTDDRASFIKSQTQLTTELDALGATARGDAKGGYKHGLDLDDDNDSWSSDSIRNQKAAQMPLPMATAGSRDPPRSPADPSLPLFPSAARDPSPFADNPGVYHGAYQAESRHNSDLPLMSQRPGADSPGPFAGPGSSQTNLRGGYRMANNASPGGARGQNNASPWQRGAGYDH